MAGVGRNLVEIHPGSRQMRQPQVTRCVGRKLRNTRTLGKALDNF